MLARRFVPVARILVTARPLSTSSSGSHPFPPLKSLPPSLAALLAETRSQADELVSVRALGQDAAEQGDQEMATEAEAEAESIEERLAQSTARATGALSVHAWMLEQGFDDASQVPDTAIVEVRAGTGGAEARLFAADLARTYRIVSEHVGLRVKTLEEDRDIVLEVAPGGKAGRKARRELDVDEEADAEAEDTVAGAFTFLWAEAGVHRVQRVPATESNGRVHTSTATVAVLPVAKEVDVKIEDKDIRVDVYRAQGAGGQHVNTTDSAVRVTHLPTGIVAQSQDERSQHMNKAKALSVLRTRIHEEVRVRQMAERAAARSQQVGTGSRTERVRTYNWAQDRITDHRVGVATTLRALEQDPATMDQFMARVRRGLREQALHRFIAAETKDNAD
jgi:peptide chain release factor 1